MDSAILTVLSANDHSYIDPLLVWRLLRRIIGTSFTAKGVSVEDAELDKVKRHMRRARDATDI